MVSMPTCKAVASMSTHECSMTAGVLGVRGVEWTVRIMVR